MPDVVDQTHADAEAAIVAAGLIVHSVTTQYGTSVPAGHIISQNPAGGTTAEINSVVYIVVSLGPLMVTVPSVIGMAQATAQSTITGAGLTVGTVTQLPSSSVPAGQVIEQNPASGIYVNEGAAVNLVVSLGLTTGVVPNVIGIAQSLAQSAITSAGFSVGAITTQYHDTIPSGSVISQNPAAGATPTAGSPVDLVVSEGPQPLALSVMLPSNLTVESPYEIIGTICGSTLASYEIELAPQGTDAYRTIAHGESCVEDDVLGVIDPTVLTNGLYDLRFTVHETTGAISRAIAGEPIDIAGTLKIGQFSLAFDDITIPVSGIPITVTRTYNSFDKQKGDFGVGWDLYLGSGVKIQVTRALGYNWYADYDHCIQPFYGQCPAWSYKLATPNVPKVLITYADGRQDRFEFTPVFSSPEADLQLATAAFTPLEGTTSTLEVVGISDLLLVGGLSGDTLYDSDMEPFDPDLFRLTTAEGMVLILSRSEGLKRMTDPNGNTLTFGPNGVNHSTGKAISMERDSRGRITRVTDPMGYAVAYEYDAAGDLVGFTDRENNLTQYGYDSDHNLNSIIDGRGVEILQLTYDAQGRMVGSVDGLGNSKQIDHDMDNAIEYVTDDDNNTWAYIYDNDGNIIVETDPDSHETQYTYDGNGNMLSKTDALVHTWKWNYDARNNKLTEEDPLGNTTKWTYNSRNQILTITDPNNNVTKYVYDANGNLVEKTNALSETTNYAYDAQGNRTSMTTYCGTEPVTHTYEYDSYGNRTAVIDPLGNITEYTYDNNGNERTVTKTRTLENGDIASLITTKDYDRQGRLTIETDPYGNYEETEYNAIGKTSSMFDKNGHPTRYGYDNAGNLTRTDYPDNTFETSTYDANGNRVTFTDRTGRVTRYFYSPLKHGTLEDAGNNRLLRIEYPDLNSTRFEYDITGRLTATIDENNNRTEFGYDKAGRRTSITDALSKETTFTYDKNGNQVSVTDANSNTTQFEYDALNRRTKVTFPDMTYTQTVYADCCTDGNCSGGQKSSEIDQANNPTSFEYDKLGRLVKVTDALNGETEYTYDEVGNRLTQTDPNDHVTRWAYDHLGRVIKRTLPMGQTETFTYDPNGNVLTKTDFNNRTTTYTYDQLNRLTGKSHQDGSTVTFTYTPIGKRETVEDHRGTTRYMYDQRDRLLKVTHPDGTPISYTYDDKGNRTSVTVPSGTTQYTFDKLNLLWTVIAPDTSVTTYTYDDVGNRQSVTYPNGTKAVYTYDDLNRLVRLENLKSTGEPISGYTYILGSAGNRLEVQEDNGRTVNYRYDKLYRLAQEDISDPVLGSQTITYTYDAFGNRMTKTDAGGTTDYVYNDNDQLISETAPGYAYSYGYDANGNTTAKSDGVLTTTYQYNDENRLVAVQSNGSQTIYMYDADGIRVAAVSDGIATDYLVDKNRPFAQVLEEVDDIGTLIASYVYGDDLISQKRDGMLSYYHYDGQMSTRYLTDNAEAITDSYVYDAFGVMLDHIGTTENSYLYTGEQYDPNAGFYYLRARYYDHNTGRFINHDPIMGSPFEPISLHKYLYAGVNPVMYSDPNGKSHLGEIMVVLAVMSVLSLIHQAQIHKFRREMAMERHWYGTLNIGQPGIPVTIGFALVNSPCGGTNEGLKTGYRISTYLVGLAGLDVGFEFLSCWLHLTTKRPNNDPYSLHGFMSIISVSGAFGLGATWKSVRMGHGYGYGPSPCSGLGASADAIFGLAICMSPGDPYLCP